jgi:hypothetical protein
MLNIESLFYFILIFSILTLSKFLFKILGTLLQKEPQQIRFSDRDLIYFGLSLSYIITFIHSS